MPKKATKFGIKLENMVELINKDEVEARMGEASAALLQNPTVVWAKFVLTDDRTNANGQRIPSEEFGNLIASGINMPVKMALGEIARGHDDSKPLGVMTHLKEESLPDGVNAIVALAALWGEERPADVKYIRQRFAEKLPVDISWEILYEDSVFNADTLSTDLYGTVLRAATIVGEPAYEGRTQFLAVAAKKWSKAYIEALPDSSFLYVDRQGNRFVPIADAEGQIDRTRVSTALENLGELNLPGTVLKEKKAVLQHLLNRFEAGASVSELSLEFANSHSSNMEEELKTVEELQAELDNRDATIAALETAKTSAETALAESQAEVTRLGETITKYETELTPLREFKAAADAEAARAEKLDEVKTKFSEAGLEVDDEYVSTNAESLLKALEAGSLDFMVQELSAFAKKNEDKTSSASIRTKVPVITNEEQDNGETPNVSELAAFLRERKTKK